MAGRGLSNMGSNAFRVHIGGGEEVSGREQTLTERLLGIVLGGLKIMT